LWPFGQNTSKSNRRVESFTRNANTLLPRPKSTPNTREKVAAAILAASGSPGNLTKERNTKRGLMFSNTVQLNNGTTLPTSRGSNNQRRTFMKKHILIAVSSLALSSSLGAFQKENSGECFRPAFQKKLKGSISDIDNFCWP
jgi:hypothetical protein